MSYYLKGEARYAKVYKPVDKYKKDEGKEWAIDVKLDAASEDILKESGCQLRKSKDGAGFYTFRRPQQKLIKDTMVTFEAPNVVDKDNNPMTADIGNGSIVTIKVEIYNTRMGVGHTLEAVRVEELVPYEGGKTVAPADVVPF